MKVVKNNVVKMDWDADGFVETKSRGFISAVHLYNDKAVAFRDGKIYTHISDDGEVIGFQDLVGEIKGAVKSKDGDYPYFYADYAEIFDGKEFSEPILSSLGIAEYKDDMLARLKDLDDYWVMVETEMP